jgi:hypothetical protein
MQQRIQRCISNENHITATTAIATRWTTARHKLLTPERCNTVTSVTPCNVNLGSINEHFKIKATRKSKRRKKLSDAAQVMLLRRRELLRQLALSSSLLRWINTDELTRPAFVLKLDDTVDKSKQRIVLAATDVVAWFPLCAALAGYDVSTQHAFAAEFLEAQTLRIRIATIAR